MGLGDAIHDFFSSGKGLVRLAADRALATGVWSALPTPSADFRGGWFRTEGGAGVEDAHYLALKNAADAPVFDEIATLAATQTFTNKTLTAPTIADLTNLQHDHGDADDGGLIPATSVTGLGLVFLSATPFTTSAAASTPDATFSATYTNYLVVITLTAQSAANDVLLRLRVGGADASGATYTSERFGYDSAAGSAASASAGGTSWRIMDTAAVAITDSLTVLHLMNPFATNETLFVAKSTYRNASPAGVSEETGGYYNATTSYDALTVLPSGGTITGTVTVYGMRSS
jgi:hypothetical protein